MPPYTRAQPPPAKPSYRELGFSAPGYAVSPPRGSPTDGGSAGAAPAAAAQLPRNYVDQSHPPAGPSPSPPPDVPSSGNRGACLPELGGGAQGAGQPVEGFKAQPQPTLEEQAPPADEAAQLYADVAPEHQFRMVSSSDDDSDSDTGGF